MKKAIRLSFIILALTVVLIALSSCAVQDNMEKRAVSKDLDRIEKVINDANEASIVGELKIECYIDEEYNNIISKQEIYKSQSPYSYQYTENLGVLVNDEFSKTITQSGYKDGKMYSSWNDGAISESFYSKISDDDYKQHREKFAQNIIINSENVKIEAYEKSENGIIIKYKVTGNQEIVKLQNIYFANIGILLSNTHKIRGVDFEIQANKDYNLQSYKISLDFQRVVKTEKRFTPKAVFEIKDIEYSGSLKYDVDFSEFNECDDLRPYEIAQSDIYHMIANESGSFKNATLIVQKAKYRETRTDTTQEFSFENLDSGFSYYNTQADAIGMGNIDLGAHNTSYKYADKVLTTYSGNTVKKTKNYESDKPAYLTVMNKITPVNLTLEGLASLKAVDGEKGVFELYYDEPKYNIDAPTYVTEDYAKIRITIVDSKLVKLEYELFVRIKEEQTYKANIVCEYN